MTDDAVPLPNLTDPMPDERLIGRYVAGECTLPERVAMERWISANPVWREGLMTLRYDSDANRSGRCDPIDRTIAKQRLFAHLGLDAGVPLELPAPSRSWKPSRPALYSMAACALSLVAIVIASLGTFTSHSKPDVISRVSTYTTGNGQRATITLPDGSRVMLNVGSRLEVPVDYDRGNRTIRLSGAALFTVTHHTGNPFTVVAGPSTTRVLGTEFIVRHYVSDTAATIAVRDGKVAVSTKVLTADQQIAVSAQGVGTVRSAVASQFDFSSGLLSFSKTPLPEAIPELNRWYDADIRLGDSLISLQRVSGNFKMGSLTDLSAILTLMFDVRIVQDGRILTLYSRQ